MLRFQIIAKSSQGRVKLNFLMRRQLLWEYSAAQIGHACFILFLTVSPIGYIVYSLIWNWTSPENSEGSHDRLNGLRKPWEKPDKSLKKHIQYWIDREMLIRWDPNSEPPETILNGGFDSDAIVLFSLNHDRSQQTNDNEQSLIASYIHWRLSIPRPRIGAITSNDVSRIASSRDGSSLCKPSELNTLPSFLTVLFALLRFMQNPHRRLNLVEWSVNLVKGRCQIPESEVKKTIGKSCKVLKKFIVKAAVCRNHSPNFGG
jgi:hypothetical protein